MTALIRCEAYDGKICWWATFDHYFGLAVAAPSLNELRDLLKEYAEVFVERLVDVISGDPIGYVCHHVEGSFRA